MPSTIAILLTCHNRREKTLACLRCLTDQNLPTHVRTTITLVDDGSTDGTAEAVEAEFPQTTILRGNGNLFWCGGMRLAWSSASRQNPEYYLLANDDTLVDKNAIRCLFDMVSSPESRIIAVAAIRDPDSGMRTYGGIRGDNTPVGVSGKVEECDTFNANAVIVPRIVYSELGGFHASYTHGMGDFDYGYLASRRGIKVVQSAEMLGTCQRNPSTGTWRDKSLTRTKRLKMLQSPKGLPWKEWTVYNRRNAGWKWPWRSVSPFLRILAGK